MENLFPAFRFHTPSTVNITPWAAPNAPRSSRRQRGGDGATPLAKPVVLVRSTSALHPANNQKVVEGPYNPSFNPSPLSLASKRHVETPVSIRACLPSMTPKATPTDAAALASVGVVFNNRSDDDVQVFCTKLGARRILEFRLAPGATSERHVVGRSTTPTTFQGIQLVYFDWERKMAAPGYRFPIAATDGVAASDLPSEGIGLAFASNCIGNEVYVLYRVDSLGRATHVSELPRGEPLRVAASPSEPYIVQCTSSQRGVAITVDGSVSTSKARFSIVLDDVADTISFMAQTLKTTDESIVLISFLPSRPLDYS